MAVSSLSVDQLAVVEGTIILHITFAIKQDQELGRQFIKYLKVRREIQLSFNLRILLQPGESVFNQRDIKMYLMKCYIERCPYCGELRYSLSIS